MKTKNWRDGGAIIRAGAIIETNTVYVCTQLKITKKLHAVLGKSCSQAKHTAMHVLPGQKMPPQVLSWQQMAKATFSQPYITIYVYEKD